MCHRFMVTLLTLLCGIPFTGANESQKLYPPYPEVWGYELPMPRKDDSRSHLEPTKLRDGDYAFTYVKSRIKGANGEKTTHKHQFALMHFFSGAQQDITGDDLDRFWAEHKRVWGLGSPFPRAYFSDGSMIRRWGPVVESCSSALRGWSIAKLDAKEKVIKQVVPAVLYDRPRKDIARYPCEGNELYDKDYFMRSIGSYDWWVLPLEDDTFLLYSEGENIILRLDKDFGSKSDLLNRRVFLIEADSYRKIAWHTSGDDQAINDAITQYVLKLKQEIRK